MGYFFIGFVLLAILCVLRGTAFLEQATLFETDPNFRERAMGIRLAGYFSNAFSIAAGLAAVVTLALWMW